MAFWVYQNWTAEKKAIIHHESCGFCNAGKGIHSKKEDKRNGTWHGPFETYLLAKEKADGLKSNARDCSFCVHLHTL